VLLSREYYCCGSIAPLRSQRAEFQQFSCWLVFFECLLSSFDRRVWDVEVRLLWVGSGRLVAKTERPVSVLSCRATNQRQQRSDIGYRPSSNVLQPPANSRRSMR